MEKSCEICGYTSNLILCEDSITRCKVCKDKAVFGHVITYAMLRDASLTELNQIIERQEKWDNEAAVLGD